MKKTGVTIEILVSELQSNPYPWGKRKAVHVKSEIVVVEYFSPVFDKNMTGPQIAYSEETKFDLFIECEDTQMSFNSLEEALSFAPVFIHLLDD